MPLRPYAKALWPYAKASWPHRENAGLLTDSHNEFPSNYQRR